MALRIGIDMDGTVADLSSAYHEVERRLFGDRVALPAEVARPGVEGREADIEEEEQEEASDGRRALRAAKHEARERDLIWEAIRSTPDFWLGLRPLEPGVVRQLFEVSVKRGWETFFITQRPSTAGKTVQRQTQEWLAREGFEMPSVLTLHGGRGRAAAALELDVLLDDYPKNCVDVVSDSRCRPILIQRAHAPNAEVAARQLGIAVARSVAEAVILLETPETRRRPSLVQRVLGKFART